MDYLESIGLYIEILPPGVRGQVRDPQLPMHHPLGTRIDVSSPIAKNDGCCLTVVLLFAYSSLTKRFFL